MSDMEKSETEEIIYHYTDLNALKSIVELGNLRFTNIKYLNDKHEYEQVTTKLKAIAEEFELSKYIDGQNTFKIDFVNNLIKIRESIEKYIFTMSFSTDGDSIPMWNYYAEKAGIAIGFDKFLLMSSIKDSFSRFYTAEHRLVSYDEDEHVKEIKAFCKKSEELLAVYGNVDARISLNKEIKQLFTSASFYKEKCFDYEKEYRAVITVSEKVIVKSGKSFRDCGNTPEVCCKYSVSGNTIKPFIEIGLFGDVITDWSPYIKEIIISPLNNSDMAEDGIFDFLVANNISIERDKVRKSNLPLRNL